MVGEKSKLLVERPASLSSPMEVPQKTLCGPGPTNMYPRVQQSLSLPLLGHMHQEFTKIMDDIQVRLLLVLIFVTPRVTIDQHFQTTFDMFLAF